MGLIRPRRAHPPFTATALHRHGHNEASGGLFPVGKAFSLAIVFFRLGEKNRDLEAYCIFMVYLHVSVSFSLSLDDKCLQINWIIVFKPWLQVCLGACVCYPPVVGGRRGQSDEFL